MKWRSKMKKLLMILVGAALMSALASPAMASLTWDYLFADGDGTSLTSPYPGAIVDTFSGTRPGWTYTGNAVIYTSDVANKASAPWSALDNAKDNTPYLAVPSDGTSSGFPYVVTVDFGAGSLNYLGLHWGSMDAYNQIEFLSGGIGGSVVETITGDQVWINDGPAGGQAILNTNQYVNFFSTSAFDAIKITSFGQPGYPDTSAPYAFELDNLTIIPEPATICLLGLGALSLVRRKK
jgi:hypothetical protein